MKRIKYYGLSDLATGWMIAEIEEFAESYSLEHPVQDINDAIEDYNVCQFIDSGLRLKRWTDEFYGKFCEMKNTLWPAFCHYFSTIDGTNFLQIAEQVDRIYKKDFLALVAKLNATNRIPESEFIKAITYGTLSLVEVLSVDKLVKTYGPGLKDVFLGNPENAKLLLDVVAPPNWSGGELNIHLPRTISNAEYEDLIRRYIDSPNPNPNYLGSIIKYQNKGEIRLEDDTKYKAKKRLANIENIYLENDKGAEYSLTVGFRNQTEPKVVNSDGLHVKVFYDRNWITENLDYPTILNNFIYIFEFTDVHIKANLIAKRNETSTFLSIFSGLRSTDYPTSGSFAAKTQIAFLSLRTYSELLKAEGISIEQR